MTPQAKVTVSLDPLIYQLTVLRDLARSIAHALDTAAAALTPPSLPLSMFPPDHPSYPGDMPWNWLCHYTNCMFRSTTLGEARQHLKDHTDGLVDTGRNGMGLPDPHDGTPEVR